LIQILLIGRSGGLGWELQRTLAALGEVHTAGHPEIDLERTDLLRELVRKVKPQLIVNAAAYTAIDEAESEPERAWKVNAGAAGILAEEARRLKAVCIHYSTDYVFDGRKGSPYVETDPPNPINSYGRSKLEGERLIRDVDDAYIILRTGWLYSLRRPGGFVNKVLAWARQREVLRIVEDQVGSPTWSRMLAEATAGMIARGGEQIYDFLKSHQGIYHVAGRGACSRLEWAQLILRYDPHPEQQCVRKIEPALSSEFPAPASRPAYSALDCNRFEKTFDLRLPDWEDCLRLAMQE